MATDHVLKESVLFRAVAVDTLEWPASSDAGLPEPSLLFFPTSALLL